MRVSLTASEMLLAALAGCMRQVENVKTGRHPYGNLSPGLGEWHANIEGALAEAAVAKGLGVYWPGKGTFRGDDVSGGLQVRSTPYATGCLPLQPTDPDDATFWLVTGGMGTYEIRGSIGGRDGKRQEWWQHKPGTHRPAFYVPQSALKEPPK